MSYYVLRFITDASFTVLPSCQIHPRFGFFRCRCRLDLAVDSSSPPPPRQGSRCEWCSMCPIAAAAVAEGGTGGIPNMPAAAACCRLVATLNFSSAISLSHFFTCFRSLARRFWNQILTCSGEKGNESPLLEQLTVWPYLSLRQGEGLRQLCLSSDGDILAELILLF